MNPFVERHQDKIAGVISCFDRVVITGTLPDIGHAQAMAGYLTYHDFRLFDFPRWAQPLREDIRNHAQRLAAKSDLKIEFIRNHKAFRKEQRIKDVLKERGEHPGLVHIFSAMETCASYRPWHDKKTHHTSLKSSISKCLHYYFYFIDESFGLCYVRVPTWAPFRLQVYFNGHNWLARRLDKAGIAYEMADNAFLSISDFKQAQRLAERLDAKQIHRHLNRWAKRFCPPLKWFRSGYHWSFMQVEYATDVLFHHLSQEARAGLREFRIPNDFGNELLEFQTAAVKIAAHHVNRRGGALIGDVAGEWCISGFRAVDLSGSHRLGKTLMATALARILEDDYGLETLHHLPEEPRADVGRRTTGTATGCEDGSSRSVAYSASCRKCAATASCSSTRATICATGRASAIAPFASTSTRTTASASCFPQHPTTRPTRTCPASSACS